MTSTPGQKEEAQACLNYEGLWKKHGGSFHGPNVEHVSMEASRFPQFCKALVAAARPSPPDEAGETLTETHSRLSEALDYPTFPSPPGGKPETIVRCDDLMRALDAVPRAVLSQKDKDHG